jgi:hypothetical protein
VKLRSGQIGDVKEAMEILLSDAAHGQVVVFGVGRGADRVKVTRVLFRGRWGGEIRVSIRKPSYDERQYLERKRKAGEVAGRYWVSRLVK